MPKINCAVIGVGYLGQFHAQKYHKLEQANLIAVCDVDKKKCDAIAAELGTTAIYDYKLLLDKVQAVSIATHTTTHFDIAKEFLKKGVHVLIEKPITTSVAQATQLIAIAKENNAKIQVGHLERFNSARMALSEFLDKPLFIESQRLAPFKPRGLDVNVVLDLMIHDIEIVQSIVDSPIKTLDAHGTPVLSNSIDIANARIVFENNCVANFTASRISFKSERMMRIFQSKSYISLDFQNKKFAIFEKGSKELFPGIPEIIRHESIFEKSDALFEEIKSFIECIIFDRKPLVSGIEGKNALATAGAITAEIEKNLSQHV